MTFKKESDYSCFQFLKETPNLEVLVVSLYSRGSPPLFPSHLTLPRLHTLHGPVGRLHEHLVLPALQTIHLSAFWGGVSSFIELAVRSAWSLRSIRIGTLVATLANCIACLRSLPSVTTVAIESFRLTRPDLEELVMLLHKDSTIVPALETLSLQRCNGRGYGKCSYRDRMEPTVRRPS
ncbi:hypothetical protein C8R45DRAFT_1030359 [Mycena sanguinolenta]|nr:hypothetical protein C8R45DRAFT_1030359 [Mycena sanguinolenta]